MKKKNVTDTLRAAGSNSRPTGVALAATPAWTPPAGPQVSGECWQGEGMIVVVSARPCAHFVSRYKECVQPLHTGGKKTS